MGRFISADDLFHAHCFLTLPDGTATDLGLLAQGGRCIATGIDDDGEVVGAADVLPSGPMHAFLWRAGVMSDLGTLGGDTSMASDIDGRGRIVGRSNLTIDGPGHAFVWKQGLMTDIGGSADFPDTTANAINDRGQVVGECIRARDGSAHALQFSDDGVVALEDEVPQLGDWLLVSAASINDDGVIVLDERMLDHVEVRRPVARIDGDIQRTSRSRARCWRSRTPRCWSTTMSRSRTPRIRPGAVASPARFFERELDGWTSHGVRGSGALTLY